MLKKFYPLFFSFILIFLLFGIFLYWGFLFKEDVLKIGVMVPLSEKKISSGLTNLELIELGVKNINLDGGINGYNVELVVRDSQCSSEGGLQAMEYFYSQKIKFVLGGICSDSVVGAKDFINENKIILISSKAITLDLSDVDDFIYRNIPSVKNLANILSNEVYGDGVRKMGIINEQSNSMVSFKNEFIDDFTNLGGGIVFEHSFMSDLDLTEVSNSLKAFETIDMDGFLVLVDSKISMKFLVSKLEKINFSGLFYFTDIVDDYDFIFFREFLDKSKFVGYEIDINNNLSKSLIESYKIEYGREILRIQNFEYSAASFDLPFILKQGFSNCEFNNTVCVKSNLDNLGDFEGVLGVYSFNEFGDVELPVFKYVLDYGESLKLRD